MDNERENSTTNGVQHNWMNGIEEEKEDEELMSSNPMSSISSSGVFGEEQETVDDELRYRPSHGIVKKIIPIFRGEKR